MHSYSLPYIRRRCTPIHCLILGDDALLYIALYKETVHSYTLPYIRQRCPPIHCLILGDDALLYVTYVMLIWAPIIPATRWSCSGLPADSNHGGLQLHVVARIRGAHKSITGLVHYLLDIKSLAKLSGHSMLQLAHNFIISHSGFISCP